MSSTTTKLVEPRTGTDSASLNLAKRGLKRWDTGFREIITQYVRNGAILVHENNHVTMRCACRANEHMATFARTPSDYRAGANAKRYFRRWDGPHCSGRGVSLNPR